MRNSNHVLNRNLTRYSTRMLGGLRRPPNDLVIACRALEEVFRIGSRLHPYIQEQLQLEKDRASQAQIRAALDRIYGPEHIFG